MRHISTVLRVAVVLLTIDALSPNWANAQGFNDFLKKVDNTTREVNRATQNVDNLIRSTKKPEPPKKTPSSDRTTSNSSLPSGPTRQPKIDETKSVVENRKKYFVDKEGELFYIIGFDVYAPQVYTDEEREKKAMRNVLTKDKNENSFLRKFFIFSINNKKTNIQHFTCDEPSLDIKVVKRESSGIPKQVMATYQYRDNAGNVLPDKRQIEILFGEGLAYYIWYPNENAFATDPEKDGAIGSMIYSDKLYLEKKRLIKELAIAQRDYRIKVVNPKLSDSLSAAIIKNFPGVDCARCLSRTVDSDPMKKVTEYGNGRGDKQSKTEYYTDHHVTIVNKCNKTIKAVGYSHGYGDKGQMTFYIHTRILKPKQVISFTHSTDDPLGGAIVALITGKGEAEDMDLSRVNKKYDVESGGLQFLRVIEVK